MDGGITDEETVDKAVVEGAAESPSEPEGQPTALELAAATEEASGVDPAKRVAAVGKVIGGGALAAVGVPMLILPGPGVAAIAVGGLVAAKGVAELTGKENPVISQIESHPKYQEAAEQARQARDTVAAAASEAAGQIPGAMASAGKAVIDVAGANLPEGVKSAAEKAAPVAEGVRSAAEKAAPVVRGAAEAAAPVVRGAAEVAAPVAKAAGRGIAAGASALAGAVGNLVKRK